MREIDYEPLFLGIDGGGTKCKVQLEDAQGNFLGQGIGGPANLVRSVEGSIAAIMEAASQALQQAGLGLANLARIHATAGLAGANVSQYKSQFALWQHPFAHLSITTDMEIACLGAHREHDGGLIIIGTGFCAGVQINRLVSEFGGYGLFLGDRASGSGIGLQAVQHCLKVLDGMEELSAFSQALVTALEVSTAEQLAAKAIGAPPGFYAQLAPQVFEFAEQHNWAAVEIIQQAANYIEHYCQFLLSKTSNRLSLIGGTSGAILPWLDKGLQAKITPPLGSPEAGALHLAREQFTHGKP